jgi:hypothetical protein
MRSETYMVVDPRHDHSFRVPRPDLTAALGSAQARDACSDCHKDRPAEWAARAVKRFYPAGRQTQPHFATALHAGRTFQPDAERALLAVVKDAAQPGIVRGTAVTLLPPYLGPDSLPALERRATPTRWCGWARPARSKRCRRASACGSACSSCGTRCGRCASRR